MAEITGVLLAAGFSRRFGSPKLLAEINNQPLIAHSVAALAPCDQIIAVVQADDQPLQSVLKSLGIDWVVNPQPERGIGYSIACAIKATSYSSGWCILPADMPGLMASTTQQLVDVLREGSVLAAPCYRNRRGHPVAFSAQFRDALSALDGDTGARNILQSHTDLLATIETDDAGVLKDIDSWQDID